MKKVERGWDIWTLIQMIQGLSGDDVVRSALNDRQVERTFRRA